MTPTTIGTVDKVVGVKVVRLAGGASLVSVVSVVIVGVGVESEGVASIISGDSVAGGGVELASIAFSVRLATNVGVTSA